MVWFIHNCSRVEICLVGIFCLAHDKRFVSNTEYKLWPFCSVQRFVTSALSRKADADFDAELINISVTVEYSLSVCASCQVLSEHSNDVLISYAPDLEVNCIDAVISSCAFSNQFVRFLRLQNVAAGSSMPTTDKAEKGKCICVFRLIINYSLLILWLLKVILNFYCQSCFPTLFVWQFCKIKE